MSTPAIIPVSPLDEEDLGVTSPSWDPNDNSDPQRRPRKGKERESVYNYDNADSVLDLAQEPTGKAAYPPVNDEQEESRRIQENLKRWEQAELQRRKTARQSSASTTTTTSLVDTVSRRASLLWPAKRKTNSVSHSGLGHHAKLPSTDNLPLTNIAASPTPSPSRSETDVTLTNVGDAGPGTSKGPRAPVAARNHHPHHHLGTPLEDPFNPPEELFVESPMSPFADPSMTPGADQTSALMGSSPSSYLSPSLAGSHSQHRHHNHLHTHTGTISRQPPPPRPLGLPRPKTPPPPLDGDLPGKSSGERGDEDDSSSEGVQAPRQTKWWHEWICGCSEGPDRGGDHQAGKTNPFE